MKNPKAGHAYLLRGTLCLFLLSAWGATGAEPTALELVKEGNRFLGEQSKDKVLAVHSEKSFLSLTPNVWYVAYFDPDALSKQAEVKFGAGRQIGIKRGWRPLGRSGTMDRVMDLKKLKYDSDYVIKAATTDPLVAKLTIKATQLWLENNELAPVWKVRLWAAKLKQPNTTVSIGDLYISAETGRVVKTGLHLDKVS